MMMELQTQAAEIRRHHDAVHAAARTAIEHALAAGQLLAEVKDTLPHGGFEDWLAANCTFSSRTARRYMQLHIHRDTLPSGAGVKVALEHLKSDTVSELPDDVSDLQYVPHWLPAIGQAVITGSLMESCWMVWLSDAEHASAAAWVIDAAKPEMSDVIFTKRPIRYDFITEQLKSMGLLDPDATKWRDIPLRLALAFDSIVRAPV
jgi:hypothetical protein